MSLRQLRVGPRRAGLILLVGQMSGCAGARPAQPKVPIDLSTPKSAAVTFTRAIAAGDAAGARAASVGDEQQEHSAEALASFIDGLRAYDQAMVRRFGNRALQVHGDVRMALHDLAEERIKDLEDPVVTSIGDHATVQPAFKQLPLTGSAPIQLRKTPAGWKVDLASTSIKDPRFSPEAAKEYGQAGKALHETAREVAAGRFKTVEEAEQGVAQ